MWPLHLAGTLAVGEPLLPMLCMRGGTSGQRKLNLGSSTLSLII
ncbi:hypothetical protein C361_00875 [Cryptococcus neoformans Tu259-1]|uniref:Uncharacterized protein n=1 Tax=Cryptococcus neoformans Tu259-1 TaxID=1230072 RepID=A0A854QH41_CRYNE|nr:hypothetical protein C361_00875 [Cryptococcus neoformans var. grubii Tu259-1]